MLRANPTVRETQAVLTRLERALQERGATTARTAGGVLSFRMPPPWRLARIGWLALITRGTGTLSAWGGGPWRVSYRLYFDALQATTAVITLGIAVFGWGWPRVTLIGGVLALWIIGYASLHLLAGHRFRDLLRNVLFDVLEPRDQPRREPANVTASSPQHPE